MSQSIPFSLLHLSETDSTSTYLKEQCGRQRLEEFTTIIADYQRTGHGQAGNLWESEEGKNLLFSLIVYPDFCEARQQFYLSQLISLSIKETLDRFTPDISIKWPNDIYWKEKKICGMLIENDLLGSQIAHSIAGIGININQTEFKSQAPNPVSLFQIKGHEYDRESILIEIILRIKEYYQQFRKGETKDIANRYFESLFRKEGLHLYQDINGIFKAQIKQIMPAGNLILLDESGTERSYAFKEVKCLLTDKTKKNDDRS
jgi:BirA family transcriptional regulator, biotin operon repressor / biotin---[acetyl-CoA-carboxylase] ligase